MGTESKVLDSDVDANEGLRRVKFADKVKTAKTTDAITTAALKASNEHRATTAPLLIIAVQPTTKPVFDLDLIVEYGNQVAASQPLIKTARHLNRQPKSFLRRVLGH